MDMYKDQYGNIWMNEEMYKEYLDICKKYRNDNSKGTRNYWKKQKEKYKKFYE